MILPAWAYVQWHSLSPDQEDLPVFVAEPHAFGSRPPAFSSLIVHALFPCVIAFLILSGYTAASAAEIPLRADTVLKKVTVHKRTRAAETEEAFLVEAIKDKEGLKKGLSFRESMPEQNGMLFVLDVAEEHGFWMKDMKFPLDIIFIDQHMQIAEVLENLQPCEECPVYFPKEKPAFALELNAGLARRRGLTVGDTLVIEK